MTVSPTYPGVYVQEVPSGVRTIVGVGTSTALFIGRTLRGPLLQPVRLNTFGDFDRAFGDDSTVSDLARYVRLFFLNGGTDCYVIRVAQGAQASSVTLQTEDAGICLVLTAKNPGVVGDTIRAAVTYNNAFPEGTFNLEVFRWDVTSTGQRQKADREEWVNLTMDPTSPSFAPTVLSQKSKLVNAVDVAPPSTTFGLSLSGKPIATNPADGPTLRAQVAALLGSTQAGRNHFRISIEGRPAIDVDLSPIIVAGLAGATIAAARTSLAAAIQGRITAAVTAAGMTGLPTPPVTVEFLQGPAAVAGETTLIRIQARTAGQNVRIQRAADLALDVAATLGLGEADGGIEVGGHARRRPAPTGVTLDISDGLGAASITGASFIGFAGATQGDVISVTLDERAPSGARVPVTLPVNLVTTAAADLMWQGAGAREKLQRLADAINTRQAAQPDRFFWKAELWGSRLAIINTADDDTSIVAGGGFATGAVLNLKAAATENVRFYSLGPSGTAGFQTPGATGTDGTAPLAADYTAAYRVAETDIDLWNLLVLPPDRTPAVTLESLWPEASAFAQSERAFLIMDPPGSWTSAQTASTGVSALRVGLSKQYSAVHFPRLRIVENGREVVVGPAGAMAGLYARIDGNRGVWKAPAGTEADVRGVSGLDVQLSDLQNGQINPVGVNALRAFPDGIVSWGARTMDGADTAASEYKYTPIRRLALFLEESLYRGLKWVVFEPNDVALWAQIRLNVGSFMQDLFRKGAFQGAKATEAYFVKCDAETTTQNDRNLGIVNIWVGFAPLKPAEFVVLYLQQIAGQLVT